MLNTVPNIRINSMEYKTQELVGWTRQWELVKANQLAFASSVGVCLGILSSDCPNRLVGPASTLSKRPVM